MQALAVICHHIVLVYFPLLDLEPSWEQILTHFYISSLWAMSGIQWT